VKVIKIDNKVSEKFRVGYRDTFYKKEANIVSIINYFSEIAQLAGSYYDLEKDILKDELIAWIILNWDISVTRYPKYGEHISVHTIAHSIDRFIAFREFLAYDADGSLITVGKSKWILFNVEKRRPAVARDYMYDLYGVKTKEPPFDIPLPKKVKNMENMIIKEFEIRKGDVDYYDHVNNAIYPLWIYESMPVAFTDANCVERIKLYYKKETTYGKSIIVHTHKNNENSYSHEITDKDGKILLLCESEWKPK
jgi:acyl-ACP thioesterase